MAVTADDNGVTIKVPAKAPDKIASVVVLEIEGKPEVAAYVVDSGRRRQRQSSWRKKPSSTARPAKCQAGRVGRTSAIGPNENDWVSWDFQVNTPGKFEVEITQACIPGDAGSDYAVAVADQTLQGKVESTGDWNKFVTRKLGTVTLSKAGRYTLSVKPTNMPHGAVMNLNR